MTRGSSKPPEHGGDQGEADEGGDGHGVTLEVASQTAIATDPAKVLSTIHLLGKTAKPETLDRFTISSFHAPVRQTTSAIFSPA